MSDVTATTDREDPESFVVVETTGWWRALKDDLLPMMALLGAVYGWAIALLVVVIAVVLVLG
ncbi:MAG TPA: hypothetical protein VJ930_03560 [Acidimicrobiia bacterium]|nr:hypothetical protein [Acidimicrobiia bacterium]